MPKNQPVYPKLQVRKIRVDYVFETMDYLEKIFDDQARKKPESLKTTINAVYRVKALLPPPQDKAREGEYYYHYATTKLCNNMLNQMAEPFSYQHYGYHRHPIIELAYDEASEPAGMSTIM